MAQSPTDTTSTPPAPTAATAAPSAPVTAWRSEAGAFVLSVDGHDLARYEEGADIDPVMSPRPFVHPVQTLAGTLLTEVGPEDHLHHFGLSAALPDVNGTSFWGGRTFVRDQGSTLLPNHGRQQVLSTALGDDAPDAPTASRLEQQLVWTDEHDAPVLRELRRLDASALPEQDAWALRWTSTLHADHDDLVFGSPATNGRPGAGYGGLFWRLGPAEATAVLSESGTGEEAAHGSSSAWVAFTQRSGATEATLVLAQTGADVWPWFLRATEYDGASPAVAWDTTRLVPQGSSLDLTLLAVLVDGAVSPEQARELVALATAALA